MAYQRGICMMNIKWKSENPHILESFSNYLNAASFRLNFIPIAPDFIFNTAGVSVAYIFMTRWKLITFYEVLTRLEKIKDQFRNIYVIVVISTNEENLSFLNAYFNLAVEKPAFIQVVDVYMGFEKMLKLALVHGEIKQVNISGRIKMEQEQQVTSLEAHIAVLTAIPEIQTHDAHMLMQGIGSIEAISKASKKQILGSTDLCSEKADKLIRFFRDRRYYLRPVIN